jgi:hypothetical protein
MLTLQAKQAAQRARGARKVTFVVCVHTGSEIEKVKYIQDRAARTQEMKSIYQNAKRSILEIVSRHKTEGLKVVNYLEGTPNLIVSGPASSWQKLFADDASGLQSPDFDLIPNTLDWSTG